MRFRCFVSSLAVALTLNGGVPEAPTGVVASDGAFPNRVTLAWNHMRDAQVYRVFRATVNDPAQALSLGVTESITFNDVTGPGESYFYWVRAEGGGGVSPLSEPQRGSAAQGAALFQGPPGLGIPPPTVRVPSANPLTGARIYLGKALFWDEQLSSTRTVACGTCHIPRAGGADPRAARGSRAVHPGADGRVGTPDDTAGSRGVPRTRADGSYVGSSAFGVREQVTPRRANSVFDAAFSVQGVLWDGAPGSRFEDPESGQAPLTVFAALEAQALLPFLNPTEMGHEGRTLGDVTARVVDSKPLALAPTVPAALARWIGGRSYAELFAEAFGTPQINAARIAMALAAYERTLLAEQTPMDGPGSLMMARAAGAFTAGRCNTCHATPLTSDNLFHATGVRPAAEDPGRGGVAGQPPVVVGQFRTPSLRSAGLRSGMFHTGQASLEEALEFYIRGGDFRGAPSFPANLISPLTLNAGQRSDLLAMLRYHLLDARALRESAPLFDRPVLYSESARVPVLVGPGVADAAGRLPEAVALEPPYAGSVRFTVAVDKVAALARAVLVIDRDDPGIGPGIPAAGSFLRRELTTQSDGNGGGFASASLALPTDAAGTTLFGRWYVESEGQVAVSRAFRFTIFEPVPETDEFLSMSAATASKGRVARGGIAMGSGTGLALETLVAAEMPLPTTLGGVRVVITDRTGVSVDAPLFFVSPGQINYLVPEEVAEGEARVRVLRGGSEVARGRLQVAALAPGFFTANADGWDTASALLLRVPAGGAAATTGTIQFNAELNRWVPLPLSLGGPNDEAFLILFGTGIRGREDGSVRAVIGGVPAEVTYAGAQGSFDGLDQVNLRIPRALAGRGSVDVTLWAGEQVANTVRVHIE